MRIVFAYILVIPLVQFAFSFGGLPASFISAFALSWLPERARCVAGGVITGICSGLAAIGFGWAMFYYVGASKQFAGWPLVATVVPLYIPLINDLRSVRELQDTERSMSEQVKTATSPMTVSLLYGFVGEIAGLAAGVYWALR